jgi:hypothetical protein
MTIAETTHSRTSGRPDATIRLRMPHLEGSGRMIACRSDETGLPFASRMAPERHPLPRVEPCHTRSVKEHA